MPQPMIFLIIVTLICTWYKVKEPHGRITYYIRSKRKNIFM